MLNVATKSTSSRDTLRLGFVALTDCAPVVMAQELGLYRKYGLNVELQREVGWATIREKIFYGELDAAHAPAGMVIAACGGLGSQRVECLTGLVMSLNGNAITVSSSLRKKGTEIGKGLREEAKRSGRVFTFGSVYSYSSHSFLLRQWLLRNGISPEVNARIVVVPPRQLPENLKSGSLDGYCVGEPWNSIAVLAKSGACVATSEDLESHHPEKVLMVRKSFADQYEQQHLRLIAALIESCRYCQKTENRDEIVRILARKEYLGVSMEAIWMGSNQNAGVGDPSIAGAKNIHVFAGQSVNEPTLDKARWVTRSIQGGGHLTERFEPTQAQLEEAFREEIFTKAMQLIS